MTVPPRALCYPHGSLPLSPRQTWLDAYLAFLGLQHEPPTLDFLRKLNRAHVSRVPFENVTSILRRAQAGETRVPPLDRQAELQAWIGRRGGGVCFEVVDMLGALLEGLGFKTHSVLATISFAGSHQANVVELAGGARYLVDAGNGAPFFEPIPISDDTRAVEVSHAGLAYRFRAAEDRPDHLVQDRWIDGAWKPFCTYDLAPASDAGRAEAYRRHHIRGQSWVVDNLTLVRPTDDSVWALRDDRLTHHSARGKTVTSLTAPADYARAAADLFDVPAAPVDAALAALRVAPQR
jgi:N-hydroxyarylamine O-acetyltransferase